MNKVHVTLAGHAESPIWLMEDGTWPYTIGLRMDCGDGGAVYLTRAQLAELADMFQQYLKLSPEDAATQFIVAAPDQSEYNYSFNKGESPRLVNAGISGPISLPQGPPQILEHDPNVPAPRLIYEDAKVEEHLAAHPAKGPSSGK